MDYAGHYETKDSGERQFFPTGSQRDRRAEKGRYDLLTPIAIRRICGVYERGAEKYDERNWEKGQPLSRYLDSALRHLFQHLEGYRDEDHLAQAAWNVLAMMHTEECVQRGLLPAELDDLPNYRPNCQEEAWVRMVPMTPEEAEKYLHIPIVEQETMQDEILRDQLPPWEED
jgi:hypothetical protein